MGYVNDVMFGALLGPQPDITREDSSRLGYGGEGGEFERGSRGGLCLCEPALHWELNLQVMHADVPSKGTEKLAVARCSDIGEQERGTRARNSEILGLTFTIICGGFQEDKSISS